MLFSKILIILTRGGGGKLTFNFNFSGHFLIFIQFFIVSIKCFVCEFTKNLWYTKKCAPGPPDAR